MIKYIAVLDADTITLNLMGRSKTFSNNEEVLENSYTKFYPQFFKRLGVISGVTGFLNTPVFIPDTISDFVKKETVRKKEKKIVPKDKPKLIKIDEIAEAASEFLDKPVEPIEVNGIDELLDFDVKIETEE